MAINWLDVEAKARTMKAASVRVIEVTSAVNTNKIAGRSLHADTLAALKTVDGPAARTEAQDAWDDLNAAMTS
jgi:hypothetical protein